MNVSACIATRGDVDMKPVLESIPADWEVIVWDNGRGRVGRRVMGTLLADIVTGKGELPDLGPHGRFAAIEYAAHDLIFVQDDDVIVSDPEYIVKGLRVSGHEHGFKGHFEGLYSENAVVCNMPLSFRDHYPDSAMVGFGAAFHRDAPQRAFDRVYAYVEAEVAAGRGVEFGPMFYRESCRLFTALTPRILVDIPKTDREMASDPSRLWKQPDHLEMRESALRLARAVRDAA